MVRNTLLTVTAMALISAAPTPAHADQSPATAIADGRSWSMRMPNGRSGKLTLKRDGTGKIGMGPFSMAATWEPTPQGLCLTTKRMGRRCMTLQASGNGYVGRGPDGGSMTLSR